MKISDSFYYVEMDTSQGTIQGFKILKEPWKDVVFTFGNFKPFDVISGKIPVEVDLRILDNPNSVSDEDLNSEEFNDLLQDIFIHICHEG